MSVQPGAWLMDGRNDPPKLPSKGWHCCGVGACDVEMGNDMGGSAALNIIGALCCGCVDTGWIASDHWPSLVNASVTSCSRGMVVESFFIDYEKRKGARRTNLLLGRRGVRSDFTGSSLAAAMVLL